MKCHHLVGLLVAVCAVAAGVRALLSEEQGPALAATNPQHWAFRAPVRPSLPRLQSPGWARNAIDHFVLARLEKKSWTPAPEADRVTLLRRLTLDLIGIPPTVEEVDAFLADSRPDAYEHVVSRLLSSPHYGERWGRHWLDAARYADSDGFEKDKWRTVWFYRDWVIDAFNRDLPYDRFVIEQLAGDLLPEVTQDQLVATGFLRNSMLNEEGGVDPEQFRMEAMFDRMEAIGKGVLGLTVQCSQCHDHKYDPLSQEEYYQLFAYLNNDHEASIPVYTASDSMARAEIFRRIREIETELQHRNPDWRERMARWEEGVRENQPQWTTLELQVDDTTASGQKYLPQSDGSLLAQSYSPTKHRVRFDAVTELEGITAFRLELLKDPNLPLGGPGRSVLGTCALTEFQVEAAPVGDGSLPVKVEIVDATADVSLPERPLSPIFDDRGEGSRVVGPISFAVDDREETAWDIDAGAARRNRERKAVFRSAAPVGYRGGTRLSFRLLQLHGGWNNNGNQSHNLGRFRISATTAADVVADPVPRSVRNLLSVRPEKRSAAQERTVFSYWRTTVADWAHANERIDALLGEHPEGASQLVLLARDRPRQTRVLERGDFLQAGDRVAPGTPAVLHPLPSGAPPTRLTFARWLVDRDSPTTARAFVNRVWQRYFGVGLVRTSEDLGTQSEPPSHPELLDWLAVDFMEGSWSVKSLHRRIVSSATYRQASRTSPQRRAADPDNRLLGRGPRLRVEGEVVRDIALAVSGLLSRRMGGPSVHPPVPSFLLKPPVSFGEKEWPQESAEERYRRAVYTFRYRSLLYPMLETFDVPNGEFSCVRRTRSNTPLQALVTLNEPVFMECAQGLARRALVDGGETDPARLRYAFRCCLGRAPRSEEAEELLGLLAKKRRYFAADEQAARDLLAGGERAPSTGSGVHRIDELAAWTIVARVLLNLDETITKE